MLLNRLCARTLGRVMVLAFGVGLTLSQMAQASVTLLRDPDIEYALEQLAAPVLSAAGLSPSQVRILLIDDSEMNAFIVDTQHIFIHSGLLLRLERAEQFQAVVAHEAAHIANGHITRRLGNLRSARTAAGMGMLLGAMASASGADSKAVTGIVLGAESAAKRRFLSHTRAEESSADLSSLRYLSRAGIDPSGAVELQKLFVGQEALNISRQDAYARTHPLNRDRMRALQGQVAGMKAAAPNPTASYWFARAKGKLSAFKRAPSWTLRRLKDSGSQDIALMREAAAQHRQSNTNAALSAIDKAISLRPQDPFLRELKGQILLESRNFSAAVTVYDQARKLAPHNGLILAGLGRALLASGRSSEALTILEAAQGRDRVDAHNLRDLAVAYAKTGKPGMASVVTAERYALQGRPKDALIHAKRAAGQLPQGSGGWQRAQDVIYAAERAVR